MVSNLKESKKHFRVWKSATQVPLILGDRESGARRDASCPLELEKIKIKLTGNVAGCCDGKIKTCF